MKSKVPIPFIKRTVDGLMPNRIGTSTVEPNIANKCCKLSGIVLSNFGLSSTAIKSLFFKKSSPVLKLDIKKGPFKAPKIHARASYTCINLTLSVSQDRSDEHTSELQSRGHL